MFSKLLFTTALVFTLSKCAIAALREDQLADIRAIKQHMVATWLAGGTSLDSTAEGLLAVGNGWWPEYTLEHPGIYHHGGAFSSPLTLARV